MLFGLVLIGGNDYDSQQGFAQIQNRGRKYTTELWLNGEVACSMVNSESLLYYA